MELLHAYNICMRAAGQSALSSVDDADPDAAEIAHSINEAKDDILGNGYPFNKDTVTLAVDGNSKVPTTGYIRVIFPAGTPSYLTIRDGFVWDSNTQTFWSQAITNVRVVIDSNWGDIPQDFQYWIAYKAAVAYLVQLKGAVPELSYFMKKEKEAKSKAEGKYPVDFGVGNGTSNWKSVYYS